MISIPGEHFSFLLRVQVQGGASEADAPQCPSVVRGSVQLIGSEQVRYFASFDQVSEILCEITMSTPPGGDSCRSDVETESQ
jgi:hypothetical protein